MLMYDSEKQNMTLGAEVTFMENYKALEGIKEFAEQKDGPKLQKKATVTTRTLPTLSVQ